MTIEEFQKIDLRVGEIVSAERVSDSAKLLKLSVDVGEAGPRTVVAGIGKAYEPAVLIGSRVVVAANLDPRELAGNTSEGMILAAHAADGSPVILTVAESAPAGSRIS